MTQAATVYAEHIAPRIADWLLAGGAGELEVWSDEIRAEVGDAAWEDAVERIDEQTEGLAWALDVNDGLWVWRENGEPWDAAEPSEAIAMPDLSKGAERGVVVNVRGTSGSGKTTVARGVMALGSVQEVQEAGRTIGYKVKNVPGLARPVIVVGPYRATCGGLDGVKTQGEALRLARLAWESGAHVLCEGLLMSASATGGEAVAGLLEACGHSVVFARLDTPLELCLDRVRGRRAARGNSKPFNEENTRSKYASSVRSMELLREAGARCVELAHTNAVAGVVGLMKEAEQ